jgi:hypothetical protein
MSAPSCILSACNYRLFTGDRAITPVSQFEPAAGNNSEFRRGNLDLSVSLLLQEDIRAKPLILPESTCRPLSHLCIAANHLLHLIRRKRSAAISAGNQHRMPSGSILEQKENFSYASFA